MLRTIVGDMQEALGYVRRHQGTTSRATAGALGWDRRRTSNALLLLHSIGLLARQLAPVMPPRFAYSTSSDETVRADKALAYQVLAPGFARLTASDLGLVENVFRRAQLAPEEKTLLQHVELERRRLGGE